MRKANELAPEHPSVLAEPLRHTCSNKCNGKQWVKTFAAIQNEDWEKAANEMLDSKWAKQVGQRAIRLSQMMRKGEWYES